MNAANPLALHDQLRSRRIAIVENRQSPVSMVHEIGFEALGKRLSQCNAGQKDGRGWLPAEIEPGPRTAERVNAVTFLVLDVEAEAEAAKAEDGRALLDENGDVIKTAQGPEPPSADEMHAEVALRGWRAILHTSYSHGGPIQPTGVNHPRYRLVFDLSRPLAKSELRPLGTHVAALLGIRDCIDEKCLEPARLFYLPRCPDSRRAQFKHWSENGAPLDVDTLLSDIRRISEAQSRASLPLRNNRSGSVIEAFNRAHEVASILQASGYQPKGQGRWLWSGSTTGMAGVILLPDSTPPRVFSHHNGDPLADGQAHDAFDCFRLLEHAGDMTTAVREAARLVGMETYSREVSHNLPAQTDRATDRGEWGEPIPLAKRVVPEPYPLDALPPVLSAAVAEVQAYVQAPMALVASSALAALSLACQAHVDVQRDDKLTGPVGLFMLTIADSGERKTTCDRFFSSAIREYQQEQAEVMKPAINEFHADQAAWQAEHDGLMAKIRDESKKARPAEELRQRLIELEQDKPVQPRVPRLLLGDETPENLAWCLASQWPSAGILSSEAGTIFGSHGMSKDSVMLNLSRLNVLWDGGELSIGRRTSESFTVSGARLTVGLQVQAETLSAFAEKSGKLARGIGFFARLLVANPQSTQGSRPFTESPASWPRLAAFNRRIAAILNCPAPIDDGRLTPAMLGLSPPAKAAWVAFHDAVEGQLVSGGELYDVKDVASKAADNAARLAALFHVFEGANERPISGETMERGIHLATWHLGESRRFFGELALPATLSQAMRLDGWLVEYCQRNRVTAVTKNHARQFGPLRDGLQLDSAIRELEELCRVRLNKDQRPASIQVNPVLLEATP